MKTTMTAITLTILISYSTAFSAEKNGTKEKKEMPKMTIEQRQKMASAHEAMASCLRSDKAIETCREELMQACQDTMGSVGCPMMGKKAKMRGMGKGMMKNKEE